MACNNFTLSILSYNMFGFKQGEIVLDNLCLDNQYYDILFIQEHWLTKFNLQKFDKYDKYNFFGISAMDTDSGVLYGRPYGGVAIMVKKSFSNNVKTIFMDERCVILSIGKCVFINVYMPCVDSTMRSYDLAVELLSAISDALYSIEFDYIFFGGDLNVNMSSKKPMALLIDSFLCEFDLQYKELNNHSHTYSNVERGCYSVIDYICLSENLLNCVYAYSVVDCINLSDHEPVQLVLLFSPPWAWHIEFAFYCMY